MAVDLTQIAGGGDDEQSTTEAIGSSAGAAIGTAVGGPIGGVIGGTVGKLVGGIFGKKKKKNNKTIVSIAAFRVRKLMIRG